MAEQSTKALPMTRELARRLAEAVHGLRKTGEFWLVTRLKPKEKFKYEIVRHDGTDGKEKADRDAKEKNAKEGASADKPLFGAFGPFLCEDEDKRNYKVMDIHLVIRENNSTADKTIKLSDALKTQGVQIGADTELPCDAVFLSHSALEKFAEPYYTFAGGVDMANVVREQFTLDNFLLMMHLPTTDYGNPDNPPSGGGTKMIDGAASVKLSKGNNLIGELEVTIIGQ